MILKGFVWEKVCDIVPIQKLYKKSIKINSIFITDWMKSKLFFCEHNFFNGKCKKYRFCLRIRKMRFKNSFLSQNFVSYFENVR